MGKSRDSANLVSDSNIFVNIATDRVGIGTTNPQYKLDVSGDINFTGTFYQNSSPFVASRWTAGVGDDIYRLTGDVGIGTANPIQQFQVGFGTSVFVIDSLGEVGIGTTNPQYTLDVLGDINFTGTFRQNGSPFVASRWTAGDGNDIYKLTGDVGIGTTNPSEKLEVSDGNILISGGALLIDQNIDQNITIPSGKNGLLIGPVTVGVGVTVDVTSGSTLVVV